MNEKPKPGRAKPWFVTCEPPAGSPGTETTSLPAPGPAAALGALPGTGDRAIVQNEANPPGATGADMDGPGRWRRRRWDRWYKRSQFAGMDRDGCGRTTMPGEASLGLIVSNEPNLPRPDRKRPWLPGSQALPTLGSSAPNEANFPPAGRKGPAAKVVRAGTAGQKRAKQSQLLPKLRGRQVPCE
jgi:hypothetical protein